jgi:hypothetical protein
MIVAAIAGAVGADTPVEPDRDEAVEWMLRELSKPAYRAAEPTWFDRLASGFFEWLQSLFEAEVPGTPPSIVWIVMVLLVIAAVVTAYFLFGRPRLNRRAAMTVGLFGEDDDRDASTMRTIARQAAARGDWTTAIQELFRALARGLSERGIVETSPGTTASGFASQASGRYPDRGDDLTSAAAVFDGVRYLGRVGVETDYLRIEQLDSAIRASAVGTGSSGAGATHAEHPVAAG